MRTSLICFNARVRRRTYFCTVSFGDQAKHRKTVHHAWVTQRPHHNGNASPKHAKILLMFVQLPNSSKITDSAVSHATFLQLRENQIRSLNPSVATQLTSKMVLLFSADRPLHSGQAMTKPTFKTCNSLCAVSENCSSDCDHARVAHATRYRTNLDSNLQSKKPILVPVWKIVPAAGSPLILFTRDFKELQLRMTRMVELTYVVALVEVPDQRLLTQQRRQLPRMQQCQPWS